MTDNTAVGFPIHEHDCDFCTYIGSYKLKHPYVDEDGRRANLPGKLVNTGDVYLNCETKPFTKYIVRYGVYGEYATTNTPSTYVLAPMIDGIDPYA